MSLLDVLKLNAGHVHFQHRHANADNNTNNNSYNASSDTTNPTTIADTTTRERRRRTRRLFFRCRRSYWRWLLLTRHRRFSAVQMLLLPSLLLLLSGSPTASAITLPVAIPPSHPKNFLTVVGEELGHGASNNAVDTALTSNRVPLASESRTVREDEVMYHFYKNGRLGANYRRKASTVFMVQLFNDLMRGMAPARTSRKLVTREDKEEGGKDKKDNKEEEDSAFTDTIRSFSADVKYTKKKRRATINFFIPFLPPNERLRSAEIRLLRKPSSRSRKRKRHKLRINVIRGGKKIEKVVLRERPVVQKNFNVFDVSSVLHPWINDNYHGNISLSIRIPKKLEKTILLSDASLKSTSLIALYLEDREFLKNMYESYTTEETRASGGSGGGNRVKKNGSGSKNNKSSSNSADKSLSRQKRDSSGNSRGGSKRRRERNRKNKRWYRAPKHEKCQMYDFDVDFDFIGWGQWIIHPKNFNARFCYGECPSPVDTKYKPTNHAMLQTLMRQKKPRLAPPTCCVPIRLAPLSMLYFEYDEIVVRHHENMIADECGCR